MAKTIINDVLLEDNFDHFGTAIDALGEISSQTADNSSILRTIHKQMLSLHHDLHDLHELVFPDHPDNQIK